MIRHIIFDLSEVLIRGLQGFEKKFCPSVGLDSELFRESMQGQKIYDLFEGRITEGAYWSLVKEDGGHEIHLPTLRMALRQYFKPLKDTPNLVRRLATRKVPMTLLSDHAREWVAYIEHTHRPILSNFSTRCYSFESGHTKVSPRAFYFAFQKSGARPDETLFIDDNPNNISVADKAGIKYTHHFQTPSGLENYLAEHGLLKEHTR